MGYKIGLLGSGSWATAMLKMMGDNKVSKEILWWVRKPEDIRYIQKHKKNPSYLSSVKLKIKKDKVLSDSLEVIKNTDIIILNTPAAYLKNALKDVKPEDMQNKIIVSAIKGIVPEENLVVGEYLTNVYGVKEEDIVVVGGPCHAEEVSQERLSYLTIASKSIENAKVFASLIKNRYIKTNVSSDVFGIEYAAILKNIYALAGGVCHALGYGDNFQAILVSNAIREMEHFVNALDTHSRVINDSAYLGDLLVTSYSQFSRNRTFGNMIGKGYSVQSAQLEMNMIAEGYYASKSIQSKLIDYKLDMPICDSIYQILYENKKPKEVINKLLHKLN